MAKIEYVTIKAYTVIRVAQLTAVILMCHFCVCLNSFIQLNKYENRSKYN